MKNRLVKITAAATAILLSFNSMAFAQSTSINDTLPTQESLKIETVLPANIDILFQINTVNQNPFKAVIAKTLASEFSNSGSEADSTKLADDLVNNNTVSFAMKLNQAPANATADMSSPEPDMYISFNSSVDNAKKLIAYSYGGTDSEIYNNVTIYNPGPNFSLTLIKGTAIISSKDNLKTIINNYKNASTTTLSYNDKFQKVQRGFLAEGFFNTYLNPTSVLLNDTESTLNSLSSDTLQGTALSMVQGLTKSVSSLINAEGFSLAQVSDGFKFSVSVNGDINYLRTNNLTFDKYNFVPSLYKSISGNGLIFYSEKNNAKAQIEDSLKIIGAGPIADMYSQLKTDFKTASGINVDTEVLPLLTGKIMFTMHNTNQLIPALSMVVDVQNKISDAHNLLTKVDNYLKTQFDAWNKTNGSIAFTTDLYAKNGISFNDYNIDLNKLNMGGLTLPASMTQIKIHAGVTNEGLLVVSTLPDLGLLSTIGTGLTDSTEFDSAFKNRDELTMGVTFLSFSSLKNYVDQVMSASGENSSEFDSIMGSLHSLYIKGYGEPDTTLQIGMFKFDTKVLTDTIDALLTTGTGSSFIMPNETTFITKPTTTKPALCDVYKNDWFYDAVTALQSKGIISGYKDGCFHPSQKVSRAEFIKMLLYGASGLTQPGKQTFNDVPMDAWYADYINYAGNNSIAKGFPDGSFHPNAPITRAEAAELIYNMFTHDTPETSSEPFTDVTNSDWFYKAVAYAYQNYIIDGSGNALFEPNRELTRAEAAKMIKGFMEQFYGTSYFEQ